MTNLATVDPEKLDALLAPYDRTDSPGFAVGVALGGTPRYRRGVGMASIELPVTLSPTIRMRIGSTTKHFCVLALMLLAEEDKLSIDDSPRRYLPELPAWADPMTIRQLMAHTSGMRDSLDLVFQSAGPGVSIEPDAQFKLLSRIDDVNFDPGAFWSYNNGGYVLLTKILERVSGKPFAEFLRERILEPVGMYDTVLRPLDTDLLPNSATLHVPKAGGGWSRGIFGPPISGEGGMVSTVDDMLRWLRHMSNPVVGSSESWAAMRTPLASNGYGLGLITQDYRDLTTVSHSGGVIGGSSQMLKVIDHDLDVVVMTNGRSGLELYNLVDAIIDTCIPGAPESAETETKAPATGVFYSSLTGRMIELAEHDGRQVAVVGGMTLPATQDEQGRLKVALLPTDLRIRPVEASEKVEALEVTEFGKSERLERVEAPQDAAQCVPLGRFENKASEMIAVIDHGEETPSLHLSSAFGSMNYSLKPLGPDLWQMTSSTPMPLGGTLEFRGNSVLFTTSRTFRLPFVRTA